MTSTSYPSHRELWQRFSPAPAFSPVPTLQRRWLRKTCPRTELLLSRAYGTSLLLPPRPPRRARRRWNPPRVADTGRQIVTDLRVHVDGSLARRKKLTARSGAPGNNPRNSPARSMLDRETNATSGARTVSGSRASKNPVSVDTTRPRPLRRTNSLNRETSHRLASFPCPRVSSASASTCPVCGIMSMGWTERIVKPRRRRNSRSRHSVAGSHER